MVSVNIENECKILAFWGVGNGVLSYRLAFPRRHAYILTIRKGIVHGGVCVDQPYPLLWSV